MDLGGSEFRLPPQRQDRFEAQQQLLERLIRVTEQLFDETVDINMKGVFFTVQKAIPLMCKGSAIVLNASTKNVPGRKSDVQECQMARSGCRLERVIVSHGEAPGREPWTG